MILRLLERRLKQTAKHFPIVTVTGPRQSGKTTLCRHAFPDKPYVSLEMPDVREYALDDPRGFLSQYKKGAVFDEVQRAPDLLSYLQLDVDERPQPGRFVLTGSANFALLESVSQSLAGRTALLTLLPCNREEVCRFDSAPGDLWEAIWTGSYPAIYDRRVPPDDWFGSYVGTYVERDVRRILNVSDLAAFQTFLRLCAGRTGQLLNLSQLGADTGITHNTARAWLSVLEASYIVFRLPPHHANWTKRLVKTPKVHFLDSGLACYLLGIMTAQQLRLHPLRGAIFESWVASEILKARLHRGLSASLSFYRDRKGVEVDVVLERGDATVAVEAKSGQTVAADFFDSLKKVERNRIAAGLPPPLKVVVHGGTTRQQRSDGQILPWSEIPQFDWLGLNSQVPLDPVTSRRL